MSATVRMGTPAVAAELRDRFERLATLIDVATPSQPSSDTRSPLLIVLDSPFRGIRVCARVPHWFPDPRDAHQWIEDQPTSADPIVEAVAFFG